MVERREMPTFSSLDEERTYRKQHLAAAFRILSRYDCGEGPAGHITARDPEFTDHFWVNPFGMHFSQIKVSDLLLISEQGEVVEGNRQVNQAAFAIHSAIHAARPDVIAAAHSHSIYGKSWSAIGRLLDPITQDACRFYGKHSVFDDYNGPVNDPDEGKRIAHALGDGIAVILQNHGLLTVGETVDAAAWFFLEMERGCQSQILAESCATPPILISHEIAERTQTSQGSPRSGWFGFQVFYDWIAELEPSLFD